METTSRRCYATGWSVDIGVFKDFDAVHAVCIAIGSDDGHGYAIQGWD
jgi:hypothetical protein